MLKAKNQNRKSVIIRKSKPNSDDLMQVTGKDYSYITTVVTGAAQYKSPLTSNSVRLDPRTVVMSDLYRYFRFDALKITFWEAQSAPASDAFSAVVTYTVGGTMTAPTTFPEVIQNAHAKLWHSVSGRNMIPAVFNIPRKVLQSGVVKWFFTEETADTDLDTQGNLIFTSMNETTGGAAAGKIGSLWEYKISFKERLASEESLRRTRLREARLASLKLEPPLPYSNDETKERDGELIDVPDNPPTIKRSPDGASTSPLGKKNNSDQDPNSLSSKELTVSLARLKTALNLKHG